MVFVLPPPHPNKNPQNGTVWFNPEIQSGYPVYNQYKSNNLMVNRWFPLKSEFMGYLKSDGYESLSNPDQRLPIVYSDGKCRRL